MCDLEHGVGIIDRISAIRKGFMTLRLKVGARAWWEIRITQDESILKNITIGAETDIIYKRGIAGETNKADSASSIRLVDSGASLEYELAE